MACKGHTLRKLPFADPPVRVVTVAYWQPQPRRVHRKGYKRRKGEKDKLNGYHREHQADD